MTVNDDHEHEHLTTADLHAVIKELSAATLALRTLIQKQYPTRREMEQQYVRKEGSRRRVILLLVIIVISALVCFVGTVTTVSACFLGDPEHPDICNLMPGYADAQERSNEFRELVINFDKRIARLEKRGNR